jgi:16S rRNA (guanine966-N2)-methyltransferase
LRIIGGTAGGRRLTTPSDRNIRPTADRVKEALFNILAGHFRSFDGLRVLDLFAGTGNLGIEALSRGAAEVLFVDSGRESLQLIRRNLELVGFTSRGRVMTRDVLTAIRQIDTGGEQFDLVFLDPPYARGIAQQVLTALAHSQLLADDTVVVAETSAREILDERYGPLRCHDRRVYGDTAVSFMCLEREE